jgi:hypothetical protein
MSTPESGHQSNGFSPPTATNGGMDNFFLFWQVLMVNFSLYLSSEMGELLQ